MQGAFPSSVTVRNPGLMAVRYFTSSGTFNKADYPGAQSVRVRVQGAGGAGGGVSGSVRSAAGGGGAGGYAESLIDIGALASSETVTVGAGGTGSSATDGTSGGGSSFGSLVSAAGGLGAPASTASDNPRNGEAGGAGIAGDLQTRGSYGTPGSVGAAYGFGGSGGASPLGGAGGQALFNGSGENGSGYGSGGGGGGNSGSSTSRSGGDGAQGIVIVEVYSTYKGGDTDQFATRQYVDEGPRGVLGYTEVRNSQNGISTETSLTGLSLTVDVPANRRIRVTGSGEVQQKTSAGRIDGNISEDSATIARWLRQTLDPEEVHRGESSVIVTPTEGSHTYSLSLLTTGGTVNLLAFSVIPAFILVEDIGPA